MQSICALQMSIFLSFNSWIESKSYLQKTVHLAAIGVGGKKLSLLLIPNLGDQAISWMQSVVTESMVSGIRRNKEDFPWIGIRLPTPRGRGFNARSSKISHTSGQLSPQATTPEPMLQLLSPVPLEPVLRSKRSPQQRSQHATTRAQSPRCRN